MTYYHRQQNGFSLVEMLVSVSILLLVVVGPMTITARTAKSSTFATEQVQAFFLAQEGLELVHKVRDDLLLNYFANAIANPWGRFTNNAGTYQHCYTANGCGLEWGAVDGSLEVPTDCTTVSDCLLKLDTTGDRAKFTYQTSGSTENTVYTRRIYLEPVAEGVYAQSVVTWRTGSLLAEQRVEAETYLYNIYATP